MSNADAGDHCRVAQRGRRVGEMVEESDTGSEQDRRDGDVDFVKGPAFSTC